jgi:hypothetical protein
MQKLVREDLMTLEAYAKERAAFRARVIAHKKDRRVAIGPNVTLAFEDRLTMHYQVQEMLRIERIFEEQGILDELAAYNPLIPDGTNWKATMMIEFPDEAERTRRLAQMIGIEDRVWVQAGDTPPVWAIADEDMERDTEDKTASVHFLRFEFTPEQIAAIKSGAAVSVGIDHPSYQYRVESLLEAARQSLSADFS